MKFRKKPVEIEATQWFPGTSVEGVLAPSPNSTTQFAPHVITPNGAVNVDPGDWIITLSPTDRYPCKPDTFEKLYEPVSDGPKIPGIDFEIEAGKIADKLYEHGRLGGGSSPVGPNDITCAEAVHRIMELIGHARRCA